MKRLLLLLLFMASLTTAAKAQKVEEVDYTKCFTLSSKKWGTHCGEKRSFEVRWENVCEENMDIKYAVRGENGWEIGIDYNVKPGEETVNSAWVCDGTGHYLWWARPSEEWMDIEFPSDDEIVKLN